MFYVGQSVVCIDDKFVEKSLTKGAVYTVSGVGRGVSGYPMLGLVEVRGGDLGWFPRRFRPVVERKTSISIFKAMLNPADKRVEA